MDRVDVEPELLRWARERAGLSVETLAGRFPRLDAWERGEILPTLKQLERFAKATLTPIGYLFLDNGIASSCGPREGNRSTSSAPADPTTTSPKLRPACAVLSGSTSRSADVFQPGPMH